MTDRHINIQAGGETRDIYTEIGKKETGSGRARHREI